MCLVIVVAYAVRSQSTVSYEFRGMDSGDRNKWINPLAMTVTAASENCYLIRGKPKDIELSMAANAMGLDPVPKRFET